jgi:hypothetical protein
MSEPKVSLAKFKSLINPVLLTSVGVVSVASFCVLKYSRNVEWHSARLNILNTTGESLPSQDLKAQYAPTTPGYTWGVTPRTPRVQTVPSTNPGYNQQPIQPIQPTQPTTNTNLGGMPTNQQTPAQGGLNSGPSSTTIVPPQTPVEGGLDSGTSGTTTMPQQTPSMSPTQSNYP